METARAALARAIDRLNLAGVEGAARDAQILLAHVLGRDSGAMAGVLDDVLSSSMAARFDEVILMRIQRRPVSHIRGRRDFWAHEFLVTDAVLDPRPDTETLVAAALEHPFNRVLDLGTGSGAIVLSLLFEMSYATGIGSDISKDALAVARQNAARLNLTDRATFCQSDWFEDITGSFDLIVANPPYISDAEMKSLAPDVFDWEPHLALTPGGDGLTPYRIIARGVSDYLAPNGRIIVEIGHSQAADVIEIFVDQGFSNAHSQKDLSGHDRIVVIEP